MERHDLGRAFHLHGPSPNVAGHVLQNGGAVRRPVNPAARTPSANRPSHFPPCDVRTICHQSRIVGNKLCSSHHVPGHSRLGQALCGLLLGRPTKFLATLTSQPPRARWSGIVVSRRVPGVKSSGFRTSYVSQGLTCSVSIRRY